MGPEKQATSRGVFQFSNVVVRALQGVDPYAFLSEAIAGNNTENFSLPEILAAHRERRYYFYYCGSETKRVAQKPLARRSSVESDAEAVSGKGRTTTLVKTAPQALPDVLRPDEQSFVRSYLEAEIPAYLRTLDDVELHELDDIVGDQAWEEDFFPQLEFVIEVVAAKLSREHHQSIGIRGIAHVASPVRECLKRMGIEAARELRRSRELPEDELLPAEKQFIKRYVVQELGLDPAQLRVSVAMINKFSDAHSRPDYEEGQFGDAITKVLMALNKALYGGSERRQLRHVRDEVLGLLYNIDLRGLEVWRIDLEDELKLEEDEVAKIEEEGEGDGGDIQKMIEELFEEEGEEHEEPFDSAQGRREEGEEREERQEREDREESEESRESEEDGESQESQEGEEGDDLKEPKEPNELESTPTGTPSAPTSSAPTSSTPTSAGPSRGSGTGLGTVLEKESETGASIFPTPPAPPDLPAAPASSTLAEKEGETSLTSPPPPLDVTHIVDTPKESDSGTTFGPFVRPGSFGGRESQPSAGPKVGAGPTAPVSISPTPPAPPTPPEEPVVIATPDAQEEALQSVEPVKGVPEFVGICIGTYVDIFLVRNEELRGSLPDIVGEAPADMVAVAGGVLDFVRMQFREGGLTLPDEELLVQTIAERLQLRHRKPFEHPQTPLKTSVQVEFKQLDRYLSASEYRQLQTNLEWVQGLEARFPLDEKHSVDVLQALGIVDIYTADHLNKLPLASIRLMTSLVTELRERIDNGNGSPVRKREEHNRARIKNYTELWSRLIKTVVVAPDIDHPVRSTSALFLDRLGDVMGLLAEATAEEKQIVAGLTSLRNELPGAHIERDREIRGEQRSLERRLQEVRESIARLTPLLDELHDGLSGLNDRFAL